VAERIGVEVGAEAAVDHAQDVAIELGGHAGGGVVGGVQRARRLDEVDAEQKTIAGTEQPEHVAQEGVATGGIEIAERGAEEGHEAGSRRRRHAIEVALEVADRRMDLADAALGQQRAAGGGRGRGSHFSRAPSPRRTSSASAARKNASSTWTSA